jgi:hypothetical protein
MPNSAKKGNARENLCRGSRHDYRRSQLGHRRQLVARASGAVRLPPARNNESWVPPRASLGCLKCRGKAHAPQKGPSAITWLGWHHCPGWQSTGAAAVPQLHFHAVGWPTAQAGVT